MGIQNAIDFSPCWQTTTLFLEESYLVHTAHIYFLPNLISFMESMLTRRGYIISKCMAKALYIMQCSFILSKESKTKDTKAKANSEEWKLPLLPLLSDCNVFVCMPVYVQVCMCCHSSAFGKPKRQQMANKT